MGKSKASLEMARTMLRSQEPPVAGQRVSSLRLHPRHARGLQQPRALDDIPRASGSAGLGRICIFSKFL